MIKVYEMPKMIAKICSKKQADQNKWQKQRNKLSGLKDHVQL